MTLAEARRIVGNQSLHCIRNMVRALKLFPRLNTPEENRRLAAAELILKEARR